VTRAPWTCCGSEPTHRRRSLTCRHRIRSRSGATRFGEPFTVRFPHVVDLETEGLVDWRGGRLALTDRGLLVADSVFSSFF